MQGQEIPLHSISNGSICEQVWFKKFKGSVFCDTRTFRASSGGIKSPQLDSIFNIKNLNYILLKYCIIYLKLYSFLDTPPLIRLSKTMQGQEIPLHSISNGSICEQVWFKKFKGSVFCDTRTFRASSGGIKSPQLDSIFNINLLWHFEPDFIRRKIYQCDIS